MPSPSASDGRSRTHYSRQIGYTFIVFAVLIAGWNLLATRFDAAAQGLVQEGQVFTDGTNNENLNATLSRLPEARALRVLVLGSSQIASVKEGTRREALPFQLQRQLQDAIGSCEVLDLSAPGQQLIESMFVLLGSGDRVRPNAVVVGVSLFSMQSTAVREAVVQAFDAKLMDGRLAECLPAEAPAAAREAIAGNLRRAAKPAGKKTIQERTDGRIGDFLAANVAMFRNRKPMFNALIDQPVRGDLVAFIQRHQSGVKIARTYSISSAYQPSLAALGAMAAFCEARGIKLVAIVLPYDSSITPIPYTAQSQQRLVADLDAIARRQGILLLDLGGLQGHEGFGQFLDGSPDGLHYRAAVHAAVAGRAASVLAPALQPPAAR